MDTSALRAAYDIVLSIATRDDAHVTQPFEAWDAREYLAHLGITDELFIETTRSVLEDRPASYDNARASFKPSVAARAEAPWEDLVDAIRSSSQELCALADQLDADHANRLVHVRVIDGLKVTVDQPLPWGQALMIQATVHLRGHADDLTKLAALQIADIGSGQTPAKQLR